MGVAAGVWGTEPFGPYITGVGAESEFSAESLAHFQWVSGSARLVPCHDSVCDFHR